MGEPYQPPPQYEEAKNAPMYPDTDAPQHQPHYQPSMTNPYPQNQAPPQYPPQNPQPQPLGTQTRSETYIYVTPEGHQFGPFPANVTCPHCHQQTRTKITFNSGVLTWVLFGLCLLFGCWFGCCLIPFCVDSCQDCDHFCSNCNAYLGHFKRL